jgi:hypothetical protein
MAFVKSSFDLKREVKFVDQSKGYQPPSNWKFASLDGG